MTRSNRFCPNLDVLGNRDLAAVLAAATLSLNEIVHENEFGVVATQGAVISDNKDLVYGYTACFVGNTAAVHNVQMRLDCDFDGQSDIVFSGFSGGDGIVHFINPLAPWTGRFPASYRITFDTASSFESSQLSVSLTAVHSLPMVPTYVFGAYRNIKLVPTTSPLEDLCQPIDVSPPVVQPAEPQITSVTSLLFEPDGINVPVGVADVFRSQIITNGPGNQTLFYRVETRDVTISRLFVHNLSESVLFPAQTYDMNGDPLDGPLTGTFLVDARLPLPADTSRVALGAIINRAGSNAELQVVQLFGGAEYRGTNFRNS